MLSRYLVCENKCSPFVFSLLIAALLTITVEAAIDLSDSVIQKFEQKYGSEQTEYVKKWRDLLAASRKKDEVEKLATVNNFFNSSFKFVDDMEHWNEKDYWATPFEFIGTGAGDCEDFSIAKYFSLLELGVPDDKLRMTYVKALAYNQSHMVVTYFPEAGSIPLVLDNINPEIKSADQRKDLLPVYSFNGAGLWLAKERGLGKKAGGADRLTLWTDLNKKLAAGL